MKMKMKNNINNINLLRIYSYNNFQKNLIKKQYNNNLDFFLKKIFIILIQKGRKFKVINIYLNWMHLLKIFFVKKFKKFNVANRKKFKFYMYKYLFINRMKFNVSPKVSFNSLYKKGILNKIPSINMSKRKNELKNYNLSSMWIKKSVEKRKEKTFILKFYSELFDINLNKGLSVSQKIEYYKSLYQNKKYYKYKTWI